MFEKFKKDEAGDVGIKGVVMAVVAIVVFTALMPVVYDVLDGVAATGTTGTLFDMLPLFAILGVVLSVIFWSIEPIEGRLSISSIRTRMSGITNWISEEWQQSKAMADATFEGGLGNRGLLDLGAMVGAIIILVVGVILYPLISTQVSTLVNNENLSGSQETLIQTVPLFYVLALVFVAIGWALRAANQ